jgi:hypothetical protein
MAYTYEKITDPIFNSTIIKATDQNGQEYWIPLEPANADYQAYLKSLDNADKL